MKGIETLSRVDILCVDKTGTITEPGMEITEVCPVKDAQDLEALAQYVEAGMDQNDTMDAIRKIPQDTSQPALGRAPDIQPLTSRKSMGPLPFGIWDLRMGAPEFVLREGSELEQEDSSCYSGRESGLGLWEI